MKTKFWTAILNSGLQLSLANCFNINLEFHTIVEVRSEAGLQFAKYRNMILSLSSVIFLASRDLFMPTKIITWIHKSECHLIKERKKSLSRRLENLSLLVWTFLFSVFRSQGNLISNHMVASWTWTFRAEAYLFIKVCVAWWVTTLDLQLPVPIELARLTLPVTTLYSLSGADSTLSFLQLYKSPSVLLVFIVSSSVLQFQLHR